MILVSDENGRITKYKPETPKSEKKFNKMVRNASKPISTPKCDALAKNMPKCIVPVVKLSAVDVAEINAKLERAGKIRLIEHTIRVLPCNDFFPLKPIHFIRMCD